jgi:hypothetical protein
MGGYCGTGNVPNFDAWLSNAWGAGGEYWSAGYCGWYNAATNLVFGQNPPYYLDDFLSVYPKFFGLPTALSGCTVTTGSSTVTVSSLNGLNYGQFVRLPGVLAPGSVIVGMGDLTITVSTPALSTASNITVMSYQASPIPAGVIQLYLNLAYSSLVQARWQEQWFIAMAWFIAHYLTLYAKSDASEVFSTLQTAIHGEAPVGGAPGTVYMLSAAPPGESLQSLTKNGLFQSPSVDYTLNGNTITLTAPTVEGDALYATWPVQVQTFTSGQPNGAQIASQGLAGGIQTNKSVGDVSVGYQPLSALEDWAAWGLTSYGQQLATMARVIGSGPMVIWALLLCFMLPRVLSA